MSKAQQNKVDFGFAQVDVTAKADQVKSVFNSVADHYDIMNDLMSMGMHRRWKHSMIADIEVRPGDVVLDLAGGTGDIGMLIKEKAEAQRANILLTISDVNEAMLAEGRKRAIDRNRFKDVAWQVIDAEHIPFDDASVDLVTMAFGIRNVTNRLQALEEIYRVLKPGGRFVCMEFSHVNTPVLKALYEAYSFNVIPKVGEWVAQDRDAYQYLVESIRMFPTREAFAEMLREAGFDKVRYTVLQQGVVAIHKGWKFAEGNR